MSKENRPSIFKNPAVGEDIVLGISEEDMATLISTVIFAQKMYEVSAKVMREQGNIEDAQKMEVNWLKAVQIAEALAVSLDPDYPRSKSEMQ